MVFSPTDVPADVDGEQLVPIQLNAPPTRLTREVIIVGKNVDPTSAGKHHDSVFAVRPSASPLISFRVGGHVIQYNSKTLRPLDSFFGRMLSVSNDDPESPQILLVEHLISACSLLGLNSIEIELDESCFGPLFSQKISQKIGFGRPTYWIPICGPGISGFINALRPHCEASGNIAEIINVTRLGIHQFTEPFDGKYRGLGRIMQIEPTDDSKLTVTIASADQTDIRNCPTGKPFSINSSDDLTAHVGARPIMRITNKFQELVIFLLNLSGSYALNHETYFKARPKMTIAQVIARMHQIYQNGQNEHFAHTAIADFPAELWAYLQGRHLHGHITIHNGTHGFRKNSLEELLKFCLIITTD